MSAGLAAARAREDGLAGLLHGNRGREPVNRSDDRLRQRVLKLAREKYQGVNERHLQELLARAWPTTRNDFAPARLRTVRRSRTSSA